MTEPPVGKTKDAGWQIGVSRTIGVDVDTLWTHLMSARGVETWLGAGVELPLTKGQQYETEEGTCGEVRSLRPGDRIRLTWQPEDRADPATVQVAVARAKTGSTMRFHTERLYDGNEREAMRRHWKAVIARIEAALCGDRT